MLYKIIGSTFHELQIILEVGLPGIVEGVLQSMPHIMGNGEADYLGHGFFDEARKEEAK